MASDCRLLYHAPRTSSDNIIPVVLSAGSAEGWSVGQSSEAWHQLL